MKNQHQPTLKPEGIEEVLVLAKAWCRALFALLAGSGLRAGESLALELPDLVGEVLHVRQNLDQRKLGTPKSDAGIREVDLAPELAEMLRQYIGRRSSGFIFRTRNGGPVIQRNVLRMFHSILAKAGLPKLGFHAFRRFRITHLRKNLVPEDLIKFWVGHAPQTVTDVYSKLKTDVRFRRDVAEKVGLGFELGAQMYPVVPRVSDADRSQVIEKMARPERFELPTF